MASLMSILQQAGFKGEGLKMAYAIAMAESGGNAKAHNGNASTGDNSYGLFQINMLGSMGPARRAQYGLSSNDSLFDALTNAKVAYKMSNGGKNWGPWSTYTNGAYKKYYGGSGGSISNYSDSAVSGAVKMSKDETAESYGFNEAFLNANPELKKLFNNAVNQGWSAQKFQAEIRDTKWWKTHSQSERDFLTMRYGDPKTADQKLNAAYIHVRQLAAQMGIVENPDQMKRIKAWAYNYAAKGWDDATLRDTIGKYVYFDKGEQGEGGDAINQMRSYAWSMGVTMSDKWYTNNARNVIRGVAALQDYKDQILKQAKATYSQYSKQLDAGQTMADIASPYIQSMQNILEIPAGSLSLQDKSIKAALQYKNPTTGAAESKPLWQFENDLRNDPRWKSTQNAQNSLMQVAHQVLSDFGVKY